MQGGRRHSWGRLSFADSPAVYEGEWRQGLRHGRGTLWFDAQQAAFYEGGQAAAWVLGCFSDPWAVRHLWGGMKLVTPRMKVTHMSRGAMGGAGDWDGDMKHGWGTMRYPSGSIYTGEWRQDVRQVRSSEAEGTTRLGGAQAEGGGGLGAPPRAAVLGVRAVV